MSNPSIFKPNRKDSQLSRTHDAWRAIVDAQARARAEKLARLARARAIRAAEEAGEPLPEPIETKGKSKKQKRK